MNQNRRNLTILHHHWRLFGILTIVGFGAVFFYWFIANRFPSAPSLSSRDSAIKQTEEFLATAKDYPNGSMPESVPGYLRGGIGCWTFFQQQMAQDANEHVISVISEYDSRNSLVPNRDMTEIWLSVDFANGRRAEIYYYQGGLSGCHEVID